MKVCCIPVCKIDKKIKDDTVSLKLDYSQIFFDKDVIWIERSVAEKNNVFKQLIPYVLLKNTEGKFACYLRNGNEVRLHGKWSSGVGGHIEETDVQTTLVETLKFGMYRELREELLNFDENKISLKYLGIINEVKTEVGLTHLGIVYIANCAKDYIPKPATELQQMQWKSIEQINSLDKELWTELAFNLLGNE